MPALPTTNLTGHWDASTNAEVYTTNNPGGAPSGNCTDGQDANVWRSQVNAAHLFRAITGHGTIPVWKNDAVMALPSIWFDKTGVDSNGGHRCQDSNGNFTNPGDFIAAGLDEYTILIAYHPLRHSGSSFRSMLTTTWTSYSAMTSYVSPGVYGGLAVGYEGGYDTAGPTADVYGLNSSHIIRVRKTPTHLYVSVDGGAESSVPHGNVGDLTYGGSGYYGLFTGWNINGSASTAFSGRIGEVAIWNVALSGSDLTDATQYFYDKWVDPNVLPVADAGPDQEVSTSATPGVQATATMAGAASDADGTIIATAWSQVSAPSGGAATFTDAASLTSVVTFTKAGTYVLRLTVTDDRGGVHTDDMTVVVHMVTLLWTQESGPATIIFSSTTILAPAISGATVAGTYVLRLTADDGELSAYDEMTLVVNPATPEVEPPTVDVAVGLTWVEFLDKAGTMHVSSKVELPDPSFYFHGFKEPRVISWGQIVRALSDRLGQYEGGEFTWIWSDTDRAVRALLAAPATKAFINRAVTVRMIDDVNRRLYVTPRTMWKGLVRSYQPLSPLHFQVKVGDSLAAKFSSENERQQIPARLITNADFPDCPTQNRNLAVPIIYGDVSDPISATAPPLVTGTAARGAFIDEGVQNAGFGNRVSTAAIPTGVTAVAAAGGTLSADVPNAEYGVWVTAVDAAGDETDPEPFYVDQANGGSRGSFPGHVPRDVVDGTQKLQVAWSAAAGAVSYRVYLGWYYYGTRFTQMIQTAGLSCEFTANPSQADTVTTANITPGASVISWGQFWYYRVSAVMADGETGLSQIVFGINRGYRRPIRVEWLAVPGATHYRIYRQGPAGTFTHRWQVADPAVHFDDDLLDTGVTYVDGAPAATGVIPVIPVGTRQDVNGTPWFAFLVAGHAVKEITTVFQAGVVVDAGNFGVTWAVPGKAGYSTYFPNTGTTQYLDINGNRYTMIFVIGPDGAAGADGTRPITVNVKGTESVGDSSGTLITDVHLQYLHVVQNWILQTYTSGAWLTTPTFEDDATLKVVNEASFTDASTLAGVRLVGGYPGAFVIGAAGERISRRDLIARLNVSADVDSGFDRKSRFFISMADDDPDVLTDAAAITDVNDVLAGTFATDERTTELFNFIPFVYSRDYSGKRAGGWNYESEDEDATSISDLEETKRSPKIELHMIRNTAVAEDIISHRLVRSSETPRVVTWGMGMAGLNHELGDVILMTHYQGIGAGGWTNRPLRVIRHTVDPDKFTVSLEAVDVARLFGL